MNLKEEVGPEFYFYLADGRIVKSVAQLLETLRGMEEWVYNHHVNSQKNDFLAWVNAVATK